MWNLRRNGLTHNETPPGPPWEEPAPRAPGSSSNLIATALAKVQTNSEPHPRWHASDHVPPTSTAKDQPNTGMTKRPTLANPALAILI